MLAIVPATIVAILVTSAAVPIVDSAARIGESNGDGMGWLQTVIMGGFPLWGFALGAATLAYHLRRRARCEGCHRA